MANNFFAFFFVRLGKTKHTQWYLIFNKFSSHLVGLVCGLSLLSEILTKHLKWYMRESGGFWWTTAFNTSTSPNDSLFMSWGIESIYSFAQVLALAYVKCVIQSTNQQLRKAIINLPSYEFKRKRCERILRKWKRSKSSLTHPCVYVLFRSAEFSNEREGGKITSVALINKTYFFLHFIIFHLFSSLIFTPITNNIQPKAFMLIHFNFTRNTRYRIYHCNYCCCF